MSSHESHFSKVESFLVPALPFIGTAVVAALAYWMYHLDIPSWM
ncbi:hypothetical protein SH528x_004218 [Novipirellula sp. SH528]